MRQQDSAATPNTGKATPMIDCVPEPMLDFDLRDTLRDLTVEEISFGRFREALVAYLGQMH